MAGEQSFEPAVPFRRKISKVGEGRRVMALSLNGRMADAVFVVAPYNVAIDGHETTPGPFAFTRGLCFSGRQTKCAQTNVPPPWPQIL
jgi:hypothetical protein